MEEEEFEEEKDKLREMSLTFFCAGAFSLVGAGIIVSISNNQLFDQPRTKAHMVLQSHVVKT